MMLLWDRHHSKLNEDMKNDQGEKKSGLRLDALIFANAHSSESGWGNQRCGAKIKKNCQRCTQETTSKALIAEWNHGFSGNSRKLSLLESDNFGENVSFEEYTIG
eukprot:Sdes_comp20745_c0_seq1m16631